MLLAPFVASLHARRALPLENGRGGAQQPNKDQDAGAYRVEQKSNAQGQGGSEGPAA
jgi:hypothetical protein